MNGRASGSSGFACPAAPTRIDLLARPTCHKGRAVKRTFFCFPASQSGVPSVSPKRSSSIWCLALLGSALASAHAQNLDDLLRKTVKDYPAVKAAAASVQSAQAEIDRSRGAYSPTLSINATGNKIENSDADQKTLVTPLLTWSVPINGRVSADLERSQSAARAAQAKLQVVRDDVALQVAEAWLSVVRSQQMVMLAKNNVTEHEAILSDVRKIADIDAGRSLDLTQAQVRLDAAQNNLAQRRAELVQAQERLSRYMTEPAGGPAYERYPSLTQPVPPTEQLALADLSSPALAQAKAQLDEAQARVEAAKRLHNPTLDLSLGKQYLGAVSGTHKVASATFNLPIWQGGQTDASIRSAVAQALAAQDTLSELELVVRERVRLAYADLRAAQERLQLAGQQRDSGARLVKGYGEQFRMARRTLLDLLNIQSEYASYQQAEALAQYDVQVAQWRISAALGLLSQSYVTQ